MEEKPAQKHVYLPDLDSPHEIDRTLLQTKFLSSHNSYITKRQVEGVLSKDFVLEQLKDLDKFPICIEIDIKPKDNIILIDHFTTNAESKPLLLIDELNSLYDFLNDLIISLSS